MKPPRSLAMLLAIVAIVGVCWALVMPPFQAPDSESHFAYAQTLAENFRLPGNQSRPKYSSDLVAAGNAAGAFESAFYVRAAPPVWDAAAWRAYLRLERGRNPPPKEDGGGPDSAYENPPLYYLYAAVAYLIDDSGTAFGRVGSIQLAGVLLLLATTIGGWLLAGETFGRRRMAQLTCASVVGLLPMTTFISTSVNPDALLITTWTFALWLGARVINRRAHAVDCLWLCAVTAAAILVKATSYALVVPVVVALVIGFLRRPRSERRRRSAGIGIACAALLLPVLGWIVLRNALGQPVVPEISGSSFSLGQFLSYLWQFYLPRLPFMSQFRAAPPLPVYEIWSKEGTGIFGWLTVFLPPWVYPVAGFVQATVLVIVVALLTRLRDIRRLALLAFYIVTLIALLGLLHVSDYRSLVGNQGLFLQGRYLLPIVGLIGLSFGLIVTRLPQRFKAPVCGLTLAGTLVLQVLSLVAILQAYYL